MRVLFSLVYSNSTVYIALPSDFLLLFSFFSHCLFTQFFLPKIYFYLNFPSFSISPVTLITTLNLSLPFALPYMLLFTLTLFVTLLLTTRLVIITILPPSTPAKQTLFLPLLTFRTIYPLLTVYIATFSLSCYYPFSISPNASTSFPFRFTRLTPFYWFKAAVKLEAALGF